ncbi:MAG: alpha/beta fold hydrolase [Rubrimonas sp.]|uniref:alpha/beta fold hydrolase n=1 Tax=Rubrimonas sp. TaxID=2036015 RepID=UPI002FDC9EBF
MRLAHDIFDGPADATPLVIAHGLFGSARNWRGLAARLAERRRVISVDLRNHGDSPRDARGDYPAMADDLAETIRAEAGGASGGRAHLLGHSMGGKAAMTLALTRPELLDRLIVADIAPVAYDHAHGDYIAAMRAVDLRRVARRSDAEPMLAEAVPSPGLRAFLLTNLAFEDGRARWRPDLDAIAANMEALLGFPEGLAASHSGPTLFLAGAASDYLAPARRAAAAARFPAAQFVVVEGAGHWLHADRPETVLEAVEAFLALHQK